MSGRRFGFPIPEVIDVHAHAVLPMSLGCAVRPGRRSGTAMTGSPFFRVGEYILDGFATKAPPSWMPMCGWLRWTRRVSGCK